MEHALRLIPFSIILFLTLIIYLQRVESLDPACRSTCGSLTVKYPFGTGYGCGSPRFQPYVTCVHGRDDDDQLALTTHTGSYPVTSISYATSTFIISPPDMSTCTSMKPSPNLGLDWASPFQLGQSTFILLHCKSSTASLTFRGSLLCDPSSSHLCTLMYACPAVSNLGLPMFSPTNTCCVYSPANFNGQGDLDLQALGCAGYVSMVSMGEDPTDPTRWEYGVELKYTEAALDSYYIDNKCSTCENSGGVCGYSAPSTSFRCVCGGGYNSSTDCNTYDQVEGLEWISSSSPNVRDRWRNFGSTSLILFVAAGLMRERTPEA